MKEKIKVVIVFDDSEVKEAFINEQEIPDLLGSCAYAVLRANDNEIEEASIDYYNSDGAVIIWNTPEKLEDLKGNNYE